MNTSPNIPGLQPHTVALLAEFCARHRVKALRIFGSFVRDEMAPERDVDVLLEFQAGVDPDVFELGGMQQELSEVFDRDVDLKTPEMFSPHNLHRIIAGSVLAHAA